MDSKILDFYSSLLNRFFLHFPVVCFGKSPDCTLSAGSVFFRHFPYEDFIIVHLFTSDSLSDLDVLYIDGYAKFVGVGTDCYGNLDISFKLKL